MYLFSHEKLKLAKEKLKNRYHQLSINQMLKDEIAFGQDSHLIFYYDQLLREQIDVNMKSALKNQATRVLLIKQLLEEIIAVC